MAAQPFPSTKVTTLTDHKGKPVNAVTYSNGASDHIVTGSERYVRIFNASTGTLLGTFSGHGYDVYDIAVSEGNERMCSVGGDKDVFLWDVKERSLIRRFSGHTRQVNACAFGGADGDDSVVVSGSLDATVKLWDTKSRAFKPLMTLAEAKDTVYTIDVTGHEIVAGSVDGKIRSYDLRMGRVYTDLIGSAVTSVKLNKQADSMLVSSLDSNIRLMDRKNGKLLQSYKAPKYTNTTYRIRSTLGLNDSIVLSGSETGDIFIWDLLAGTLRHTARHNSQASPGASTKNNTVSAVAFCSRRQEWCSAGGDGNVVVWGAQAP